MKGAKGGNRDRIISWLFSKETQRKRDEFLDEQQKELNERQEERIKRNDDKRIKNGEHREFVSQDASKPINLHPGKKTYIENQEKNEVRPINEINNNDLPQLDNKDVKIIEKQNPTVITQEVETEEVAEKKEDKGNVSPINKTPDVKTEEPIGEEKVTEEHEEVEIYQEELDDKEHEVEITKPFPEVVEISEETKPMADVSQVVSISIINEINRILKDDLAEIEDINYRIRVLEGLEKDEYLTREAERIKQELEELLRRFEEIKKKYDYIYDNLELSNISLMDSMEIGPIIRDYIENSKDGQDVSGTLDQIKQMQEFITIINGIIEIERQKNVVTEKVDEKIDKLNIRDDEFIKLQDEYANVDMINQQLDIYNQIIEGQIKEINAKIDNSVEMTNRIESSINLVPNMNRIMQATMMMTASTIIPPTPLGGLFKMGLMLNAATMLATAVTPQETTHHVQTITVTDYAKDILNSKATISDVLYKIDGAADQINYMKYTFEQNFAEYRGLIPEYDNLLKNIMAMENELKRNRDLASKYELDLNNSLEKNNQKVKVLEKNDNQLD